MVAIWPQELRLGCGCRSGVECLLCECEGLDSPSRTENSESKAGDRQADDQAQMLGAT